MSTTAKITFALTTLATVGIIYTVHNSQIEDRARLHQGIVRDIERQQKRTENFTKLAQQQELTKNFRRIEKQAEKTE